MSILKDKRGISIIVLIITIVVSIILASAAIVAINGTVDNANVGRFVDEMYKIDDSVNSYYIMNNELPIKENVTSVDKQYLINIVKDKVALNEELVLNADESSETIFYEIDLNKIEFTGPKRNQKNGKTDLYYISSTSRKTYDLNGAKAKGSRYYSITSRLTNVVDLGEESFENSYVTSVEGVNLSITKSNLVWTNKMGIDIKVTGKQSGDVFSLTFDGIGIEKIIKPNIQELTFDNLSELNIKGYITSDLNSINIQNFNTLSQDKKKIYVTLKREGKIIAKELIELSNYEHIVPVIGTITKSFYDNMNTISFNATDTLSGVKEIRYDYITKWASDGTTEVQYYAGIDDFTEDYMRTKSKVKQLDDTQTGKVDIKIPKEVAKIKIAVIDNAGNIRMSTFLVQ